MKEQKVESNKIYSVNTSEKALKSVLSIFLNNQNSIMISLMMNFVERRRPLKFILTVLTSVVKNGTSQRMNSSPLLNPIIVDIVEFLLP